MFCSFFSVTTPPVQDTRAGAASKTSVDAGKLKPD